MIEAFIFTVLKIIELILYLIAFPFLCIGHLISSASDTIGDAAAEFDTRTQNK